MCIVSCRKYFQKYSEKDFKTKMYHKDIYNSTAICNGKKLETT